MPTFNFTVRATDDLGAYADRNFSINVRNTTVDSFCIIESASQNDILTSTDGVNWVRRENALAFGNASTAGVIYGNGTWLAYKGGSNSNAIYKISYDAINWVPYSFVDEEDQTIPIIDNHSVQFVNGKFCFAARRTTMESPSFYTSVDGKVWKRMGSITGFGTSSVAATNRITYGDGTYWIGSSGSPSTTFAYKSTDQGVTWETVSLTGFTAWNTMGGVYYINGLWITMFNAGSGNTSTLTYATSNDGIIWTRRTTTLPSTYYKAPQVLYGNGRIVLPLAPSSSYTRTFDSVLTSEDGINWTKRTYTPLGQGESSTYTNGLYHNGMFIISSNTRTFASGHYGGIRTSSDGINWSVVSNDQISGVLSMASVG